jgi:hypothetical protein
MKPNEAAVIPQWRRALDRANAVRLGGKDYMREVRALPFRDGSTTVAHLLERGDFDESVGSVRIHDLLRAIRRIGDIRANRLLVRAGISLHRRRAQLRTLTASECQRIAHELHRIVHLWRYDVRNERSRPR